MASQEQTQQISRDTIISEILEKNPGKSALLSEMLLDFGIHCVGCSVSELESLGDGLKSHGLSDEKVEELAELYFKKYKENGGIQEKTRNFMNDLLIIACASIKGFDVIVSDDEKTMKSSIAIKAYNK